MILVISNRLSSIWSLFSAPILGLETILITYNLERETVDNILPFSQEDFINQAKTFKSQWYQDISRGDTVNIDDIENYKKIVIGANHTNYKEDYHIPITNFWEEAAQLSQTIGLIYNSNPHNPPLTSIPHSTTTVEKLQ